MSVDKVFNLKAGVIWDKMDIAFDEDLSRWISVATYIKDVCGGVPTITSARDGKHSINSTHYSGSGIDVRIRDWKVDIQMAGKTIAWLLGKRWLVVLEDTATSPHLHIQVGFLNIKNTSHIQHFGSGNFLY